MISIELQISMLIISSIVFLIVINMVSKYKLDLKYSLLWLLLSLTFIVISFFPSLVYLVSKLLSIETPANALFLMGILFALSMIFSLTIALSRSSNKVKLIKKELGILKLEVENLKKILKEKE